MPDLKQLLRDAAAQGATKEQLDVILNAYQDNLKKKDQSVASATGGFGSQLGSQTFQPTKAYVPAPLVGTGVQDFQKQEARRQVAAEKLSNKLKGQQAAYLAGQGEQGFVDVENAKLQSDYNQLQSVIQKDLGNKGNDFSITYNKLLQGTGAMISGGIDAGLNVLKYSNMTPFVNDATIIDYRANIAPDIKNFLKENIGADVDKGAERKYDEDFITGAIGGLAYSVPAMVTPFGIGLYSQAYDSGLDLINSTDAGKNLTEAEKTLFAGTLGAVMGRLEKVGLDRTLGRTLSSELANGLAFKAINELSKKGGAKITSKAIGDFAEASLRKTKNRLLNSADQGYRAFLDEFTTGGLQEVATIGAEQAVNKLKNKDIFDTQDMGEMFGRVLKSAAAEGVGGAILGTAKGGLLVNTKNHIVKKISNAKSFDDVRNLLLDVEKIGQENNYSPEEVQDVVDTVNDIVQKRQKLPQNLTPAQTTGIVSLIIDRDELTDNLKELELELNNTDDALKPVKAGELELVKKQIAAINTRIAEIAQNPEYAVQEPSTTSQVPSATEGGQNIQEGGEGVGQGIEGTQAPKEAPIQEPTAEISPEEEVARLREQEQQELLEAIPNIEEYKVDGKVDKSLITSRKDLRKYNKIYAKYDKLITPLLAEAPSQAAPTKAAGISASNKSQLNNLKSRVTDTVKSGVVQTAERAINTLKSIFPDFDIVIHEDEDSYNKKTGNPNTRGNFTYYVNPDGTYTGGTIDINLSKANERTVAHEVAHAVLLKSFGENTKLFKTFRDKISKVLNNSRNAELIKFSNLYEGYVQAEEYLAELTAILEQQQDKLSPNVLQQIAAYINDLVSKLTNGAIKPFENVKDTKDIIDFFNAVSKSIREGEAITEDGTKFKKFGEQVVKGPESKSKFQANFTDDKTGITFSYDENGDFFKELVAKGYITYDKTMEDFIGQSAVFHKPDYAFSGDILKDGFVIVEGQGGIYYPIKYHKDGLFWAASTSEAAKGLVKKINEAAKNSPDGKARLILISTSPDKVFSSYNASAGIMDVLASKVFDNKFGLNENDVKLAILESAKSNLGLDVNNRQSLKDIINTVKEKLKPENIININKRKDFVSLGENNLISKISEQITDTKNIQDLIEFFGKGIKNDKFVGTKTGKLTSANLKQAFSYMFNEPILRDEKESDLIYAVLEVPASKDGGDVVTYEKNDSHKSYPYSVVIKDKSAKTTLHILSKKVKWNDYSIDPSTGETIKKDRLLNIIPTYSGLSVPLKISSPVSKSQKINWEVSKEGKGDPTISVRNPIAQQAAQNLKEGKITNEEYRATVSENSPIGPITRFYNPAALKQIINALSSDKVDKVNTPIKNGTEVGLRLDIPAYQNKNTWVVSVHEGTTNAGKAISYTNVAKIVDVNFGVEPRGALGIASGKAKSTIGRMFGKWENIPGDTLEEKGENAKKLVQDIVNNPAWVQIGMNPFRHSYFYDRSNDIGRPVMKADEVIQVGGLVYAKNPVYGNWNDEAFEVKGLLDSSGKVVKFQKVEEEDNREALRVAGLPYLENTLDILSAKFGMPYKVIYNETSPSTGSIDYINYDEPTIIINTAKATNETPLIQYGNIFINQIKNTNKNLFSGLVKQVLNTKEGQAELEFAKEIYSNDFYEDQVQQAIVSLLAKYAKNQFDPKTGIHKAIKKVWDTILDFLSKSFNVNINEIPANTTMEQLSKILSNPNISINNKTYISEVKDEIVEDSKRALENRKKEYSEIEKIQNPELIEIVNRKYVTDKKQFDKFYSTVKEILETLKNYKDNQLLVDLTNIKSQISTFEGRENFNFDRYPLFTKLLKFVATSPRTALWMINDAIESDKDIIKSLNSNFPYITALDDDSNLTISDIIEGYSIGGRIGIEPPPVYRVYSSSLNSAAEVKAKLENDIESLNKAIKNPELGADYYYRNFRVPIGDDTYRIVGNYRDGNISIEFSSEKYGMRDANEALFFKVLPKVIDAISYMYSDVDYNTISFTPITGESSKGRDLRLKGYNIFAKRLFGDFSLVAQNDNTTIIPIPEIFKNKLLKQERTVSRSQKVEGEGKAPQKGGPLARIKQAIEKSRAGKTSVGEVKKPLEFDEFELVPREKVAEDLRNSIETPFRNEQALKTKNDSFIKRVVHNFMKASTDRKYSIVKEIVKKGGDLGELVRATIRNSKGYTGKASHIIRDINSKVFDKLSINPNLIIAGTRTSERELFDTFLNLNRIINIDNRITEKFSELVGLSNKLKKGFKDKSLSQEQLEELGLQIAKLKDYLANRKSLKINGIDADTKLIGEQGEEYIPYNSYRDVLRENYEPKQYKHSGNRTYQSTKAELNLIKETYPEVYKKFEDMSMKYYDAFRTALDDQYKNGLISKEVYDDLYSYNYIPTKYIEKLIEDQISLESPAQAAKLSSSIKNLSGGSEGDVLTNFQGIMDTYLNGTYKRIYDNTSAKTLSEAVKSASNSLGFKIQQPSGRARNGKETYAPMPVGMDGIYFFEDGVKSRIIVPKQFADEWYGREFNLGPSGDAAVIALKRVFLTNIFKAFTTKYNPLFGVLQVLVDAPQAIIASNAYPDLVLGSLQLAKDYKTVAPDIVQLIKNNKLTPLMEEAIDAGIFSDFLSTENDLFKTETLVKQNGTIDKVKYAKYLRDRVSKAGQNVLNKLAQFNEGMEYATRLAVYSRVRKNLIKKFNKENPGKELSEKDMFRITQLASAESRGIIDFSVNGTWGGTANKFLAYLNPAIQGFASAGRALKNNPWKTSVLLGEIGVGAVGVLAYSLGALTGDDDEKRKRYAEYMQLSPYQRMNYFNIYNPLAKDEDRRWIKLFRKVQPFKGWANLMEQTYLASEFGAPISPSQAMEAFKADLPIEADIEQLITKAPLVNAYFKYYENRDAFRKEPVVQNEELIADWAEGRGDKNVGEMWKNLGEITKGKIGKFGPDGMQGLSPVRTQAAIQAIIGDPSRNPTTGVLDAGTKAMFYGITGDKEAMNREFSSDIVDELMKRTGLESRMFAKPSSVDYEYQKQLEGKRLTKFTKTYNIKADINNIYNSVENPKDADKEVVNYLLPLIKDGEITKDYAKKIMNSKTKIQVAKTLAPWADDLIFAQDTDEQIDLINYYTKDSSDKKFAETLVILKGYEIINKDVANAASLERTKPKK